MIKLLYICRLQDKKRKRIENVVREKEETRRFPADLSLDNVAAGFSYFGHLRKIDDLTSDKTVILNEQFQSFAL